MKGDPEERAVQIGRYLVQSGATVRAAAQVFGVSKRYRVEGPVPPAAPGPRPLAGGTRRAAV